MLIGFVGYEANIKNRVGSNQYAFELMKALYQRDRKNDYLIYLPSPPLPDLPKERKGWRYRVIGPPRLWNIFGLPRALRQERPKPAVVFNPGHYLPLFLSLPFVISIMDLGHFRFPQELTRPILLKLKFWTSFSIKRATHIFAISESTKNDIIKYYGVNRDKVTVTYLGYDEKRFKAQASNIKIKEIKKKYRIKGDYILFLSTLKPRKNIEGLLEAFKLVISDQRSVIRSQSPVTPGLAFGSPRAGSHQSPITLVISGKKGWLYQSVFDKVKELGLTKKVVFTGFVDEEDVPDLMGGAKVFTLPSFWEGFGIPAVNAMACGVPVVVSNAGSLPEVVGEAGVMVDPYKPEEIARGIKEAIEDRDELVRKGLEQAKKFSWEKCAQETLKVLEKVGK